MKNKFANAAAAAAEEHDYNTPSDTGGFVFPEGPVLLRYVGYVEIGKHEREYKGTKKQVDYAYHIFEAFSKNVSPREDGEPQLFIERTTISGSDRSRYFKLFRLMNTDGSARVFPQLLGNAYRATVRHNKREDRTYANLTNEDGAYTISEPVQVQEDFDTGEIKRRKIKVPEATAPLRCLIWNHPDKEQWDSLFIDGMWDERKDDAGNVTKPAQSKNFYQEKIKAATNYPGSKVQEIAEGDQSFGEVEDTTDAEDVFDDDVPF